MSDPLTLTSALVLGLVTSGHCMVMCGGISSALGLATAKDVSGRPRLRLLIAYQLGRITSYTLAGLLFAGIFGSVIALLDIEAVRRSLRVLSALAFLFGALVVFGTVRDPVFRIAGKAWLKLAPLGRRLLPVTTLPRAVGFGMIWGWMPCGFVYAILIVATLQLGSLRGGATMAAFGLGTAPALLAASLGIKWLEGAAHAFSARRVAATLLLACAALTLAGPWLTHAMPFLHGWLPLDCTSIDSFARRPPSAAERLE